MCRSWCLLGAEVSDRTLAAVTHSRRRGCWVDSACCKRRERLLSATPRVRRQTCPGLPSGRRTRFATACPPRTYRRLPSQRHRCSASQRASWFRIRPQEPTAVLGAPAQQTAVRVRFRSVHTQLLNAQRTKQHAWRLSEADRIKQWRMLNVRTRASWSDGVGTRPPPPEPTPREAPQPRRS